MRVCLSAAPSLTTEYPPVSMLNLEIFAKCIVFKKQYCFRGVVVRNFAGY